ncbi:integral membrane protein [Colletotrichum limetticola]|uniref:Integral membrane protein n=1 Tax=Colletotrichum limetticola TaxID=1209924 RepID=A0ABQ9P9P7_9PEZI|nr:integral membrane protein [Colletotrichum limetticola]
MPSQQNRGPELLSVQAAFLAAAWIATSLRLYVKTSLTKSHTVDDGVMYLSTVLYSVYAAVAVHGIINGGIGRHTSDLDPESIVIALKVWYTCRGTNKLAKQMLQANIALVWISSLIYLFIVVFQCNPPNYYWAKFEGLQGSCRPAHLVPNATVAHSVIAALSDWVISILPMSILWQLQMKLEKKIRLLCFFGIGVM